VKNKPIINGLSIEKRETKGANCVSSLCRSRSPAKSCSGWFVLSNGKLWPPFPSSHPRRRRGSISRSAPTVQHQPSIRIPDPPPLHSPPVVAPHLPPPTTTTTTRLLCSCLIACFPGRLHKTLNPNLFSVSRLALRHRYRFRFRSRSNSDRPRSIPFSPRSLGRNTPAGPTFLLL